MIADECLHRKERLVEKKKNFVHIFNRYACCSAMRDIVAQIVEFAQPLDIKAEARRREDAIGSVALVQNPLHLFR
jgi:hypothetical protein